MERMGKDYDADNRYILEDKSFVDTKTNQCLNFGLKDLSRVVIELNCMERCLYNADQQIEELQRQLKEKEEELSEKSVKSYTIESYNDFLNNQCKNLIKENKRFKQQLKSQPAEIVDEIKKQITNAHCYGLRINRIFEILDDILKEYQMDKN